MLYRCNAAADEGSQVWIEFGDSVAAIRGAVERSERIRDRVESERPKTGFRLAEVLGKFAPGYRILGDRTCLVTASNDDISPACRR